MKIRFAGKLTRREFAWALELAGEPLEVSNLQVSSKLLSARLIVPAAALATTKFSRNLAKEAWASSTKAAILPSIGSSR